MADNLTYVPDVPQGNQQINNTTNSIENNFQYIEELLSVNHIPFNTPDDFGKHLYVNYIAQTIAPLSNATEMVMFSMISASTGKIELFARYPNNGAIVQLTGSNGTDSSSPSGGTYNAGFNSDGYQYGPGMWQYFPGGGFMLFGTISTLYAGVGNTSVITAKYPIAANIPQFSQTPFNIQIFNGNETRTGSGSSSGFYSCIVNDTKTFTIYNSVKSSGWTANWMAIGV